MNSMGMYQRVLRVVFTGLLFFLLTVSGAFATPVSTIVAFGDSLSDNGSADGYGIDTWTNGKVWVDYLADSSHLNCKLYDYACGGATTGDDYPNVNWQIDQYLATHSTISDDTLFTLWAGGNDFLNLTPGDDVGNTILNTVLNMGVALTKLTDAGAKNILVLNLPDLGATPRFNADLAASAGATYLSTTYNDYLSEALAGMKEDLPELNLYTLDIFGIMQGILANPESYGFDNTSSYLTYSKSDPNLRYLFWDTIHPTTQAHALIADYAFQTVAPVPEPSTLLLLGAGLAGMAVLRKRMKNG